MFTGKEIRAHDKFPLRRVVLAACPPLEGAYPDRGSTSVRVGGGFYRIFVVCPELMPKSSMVGSYSERSAVSYFLILFVCFAFRRLRFLGFRHDRNNERGS